MGLPCGCTFRSEERIVVRGAGAWLGLVFCFLGCMGLGLDQGSG